MFLTPGGDAAECERITRTHARTFSLAARLLPAAKRRAAFAVYAFCRVADDLVDDDGPASTTDRRRRLDGYRTRLGEALAGRPDDAVFRELARVVDAFALPHAPLYELVDGVGRDLDGAGYATWADLERYCQGVASSVGEMCTHVFGVPGGPGAHARAVRDARTLGVAMQLTNVLRDVGEDARRGRCYLPDEELARVGLTRADVLTDRDIGRDERWRRMMRLQVQRARALYEAAAPGIGLLAADSRRCAAACATGYAGILTAIEAQRYDTISARARLGTLARAGVLWGAWRYNALPIDLVSTGLPNGA